MRKAMPGLMFGVLSVALVACGGKSDEPYEVRRDSFSAIKGDWPLTVDTAAIACGKQNTQSVGVTINGTTYALNGTAKTFEGWPDLDRFWAFDPNVAGLRVNVGDLIDFAHSHCDASR